MKVKSQIPEYIPKQPFVEGAGATESMLLVEWLLRVCMSPMKSNMLSGIWIILFTNALNTNYPSTANI